MGLIRMTTMRQFLMTYTYDMANVFLEKECGKILNATVEWSAIDLHLNISCDRIHRVGCEVGSGGTVGLGKISWYE